MSCKIILDFFFIKLYTCCSSRPWFSVWLYNAQCAAFALRIDLFCVKQWFDTSDNAYELIFFAQSRQFHDLLNHWHQSPFPSPPSSPSQPPTNKQRLDPSPYWYNHSHRIMLQMQHFAIILLYFFTTFSGKTSHWFAVVFTDTRMETTCTTWNKINIAFLPLLRTPYKLCGPFPFRKKLSLPRLIASGRSWRAVRS